MEFVGLTLLVLFVVVSLFTAHYWNVEMKKFCKELEKTHKI